MVSSKKTSTITLHVEVAELLGKMFEGKREPLSLSVNELLRNCIDVKKTIDGQYYYLSMRAVGPEVLEIHDALANKTAEVFVGYDQNLNRHRLFCSLDNKFHCPHIGYAVIRPETRQLQDIDRLPKEKINFKKKYYLKSNEGNTPDNIPMTAIFRKKVRNMP